WHRVPKDQRDRSRQINRVLEQALVKQMEAGRFWPVAYHWLQDTRRGSGWYSYEWNDAVITGMIEKNVLAGRDVKLVSGHDFASTQYQWLVQHRFKGVQDQFPPDRYFDDMFVAEARKHQTLDWEYWQRGRDREGKVAAVAAEVLGSMSAYPFVGAPPHTMSREDFFNWHGRALQADPGARRGLIDAVSRQWGKTRFDRYAMGQARIEVGLDVASSRDAWFKAVDQWVERSQSRYKLPPALHLAGLESLAPQDLTDGERATLMDLFTVAAPVHFPRSHQHEAVLRNLHEALRKLDRKSDLVRLAGPIWQVARDTGNADFARYLSGYVQKLQDQEQHGLAAVYAGAGLDIGGNELPSDVSTALTNVRARSLVATGGAIPVPRSHPGYPLFEAQAAFIAGKVDTAWERYLSNREQLLKMVGDLDPAFLTWVIKKNTEVREFETAETLARRVMTWMDENSQNLGPEEQGQVLLAYAGIALARQEYPRAAAQFERIAATETFDGTRVAKQAKLQVAEVDRLTGQYDEAIERLERLLRKGDRFIQVEGHYQYAKVLFDQEAYVEAAEHLSQVFALAPSHADGKLLQGKLDLMLKRYENAVRVEVGLVADRESIIPGRSLEVSLEDKTLQVVGDAGDIEIRAWTDGGDEEFFNLYPAGDTKTRFQGALPTALAAVERGDHTLQVVGGELVHYSYSPAFIRNRGLDDTGPVSSMRVISPASLYASSGEILTEEEQAERQLEARIRQRLER
ncbi:MAG: tetratricopeptide repeat protein, partial [Phycisphaeraceae bacterium]|nr:tetratricopeptide repeat protein [Phycisphaeraceae bacterium]